MDEDYYRKLGFRCGLEIHQRLDTGEKLFCACSTEQDSNSIGKVYRMQRAVAGELGAIDRAARFEQGKKRRFEYNLYESSTCLVDADEEPPHELNNDALRTVLSLASAMGMNVMDEIEPMRKNVADGSDTSAFQRTMLVGFDGSITVNGRKVGIPSVCLEEESCGIEKDYGEEIAYNVDRLGIPLIEIATSADIASPQMAKDVALHIGMLLRLTGKVKRGLGTIRQDVNVSIAGGARVEIKGLQDVSMLNRFVENEVRRQKELADIAKLLARSKAMVGKAVDVTEIFEGTKAELIRKKLERGGRAIAFSLSGFAGLLGREINPNRRLGSEISDYAKTAGAGGIIHSDEDMGKYGLSREELGSLKKRLGMKDGDSFILVAEKAGIAERTIEMARERAQRAIEGVPKETRVAVNDESCTSRFTRPLPGGARMYPETDVRPISIDKKMLDEAAESAPDIEKEGRMLKAQLGDDRTVELLMRSPRLQLYRAITRRKGMDCRLVANILLQKFTELSRNGFAMDNISDEKLIDIFAAYSEDKITKQAIDELLKAASKESSLKIDGAIRALGLGRITGKELSTLVSRFKKEEKTSDVGQLKKAIMSKHRLNIDGEELNNLLA